MNLLNYQRPSFFNNYETAKNKQSSKGLRNNHSSFNTINYVKQQSSNIASILEKAQMDNKKNSFDFINNFNNYINHTNYKNNNLVKISYDSRKKSDDFAVDIPKRLKYQMDLLKNKSVKNKINKPSNNKMEIPENQIETDHFNNEKEENEEELLNNYFNFRKNSNSQNIHFSNINNNENFSIENNVFNNNLHNLNFVNGNGNIITKNNNIDNKRISIGKDKINISNTSNYLKLKKGILNENLNSQNNVNNIRNFKSEQKIESEKIVISGIHAAKIRLLKGLDLKGNKKKSDAYLNVKCVGLKADFNLNNNNDNFDNKNKLSNNVNKSSNLKKNVSGVFPSINKNEKK